MFIYTSQQLLIICYHLGNLFVKSSYLIVINEQKKLKQRAKDKYNLQFLFVFPIKGWFYTFANGFIVIHLYLAYIYSCVIMLFSSCDYRFARAHLWQNQENPIFRWF